jgi:outer membrane protein TolC
MLALIEAERSLRAAELDHDEALADALSRRAELDRALGRLPFTAAAPPAPPPTVADETETER